MATANFEFCRLCLRRKRSNWPVHAEDALSLHSRVHWVFQIKLFEGDGLPTQMCHTCLDRLSIAQQLKETILSVDTTLRVRGSNFYEQDQAMNVDDGVIPLLEVKMDHQESGDENGKNRRSRKRRRKTKDEGTAKAADTELEKYGINFTDQQEPTVPVKKEPVHGESEDVEFVLTDVDESETSLNEDYSFHSVLEIKEERDEVSDNENADLDTRLEPGTELQEHIDIDAEEKSCAESDTEYSTQLDREVVYRTGLQDVRAEYPSHISTNSEFVTTESSNSAYAEHTKYPSPPPYPSDEEYEDGASYLQEPELIIDEESDAPEIEPEGFIPVPVLTIADSADAPLNKLVFHSDGVVPVAISSVFRSERLDRTMPLTMPTFENFELSCSPSSASVHCESQDSEQQLEGGDLEEMLPITQVFKSARRKPRNAAVNGGEIAQDFHSGSVQSEESESDARLNEALDGSKITNVKERHRCERCKRWYVNFVKLSQHRCRARPLKTKKTINYVKCSLCEDVFYKLSDLNDHVRSHRHLESLQCQLCDRRFTNKTGLTKHMSVSHKQEAWASQVAHVERATEHSESGDAVVLVEEKEREVSSERSILKALLAGQRVLPHKIV